VDKADEEPSSVDYVYSAAAEVMGDPASYDEAMQSSQAALWKQAADEEFQSLKSAGTWTLCERPRGANVIGVKWVFKTKRNELGEVSRYKARLVAQGYNQVPGRDCGETFAPVHKLSSLRAVLALAAAKDWHLEQMDVETAFLNAPVRGDVYVKQPQGYERRGPNGEELVCRLNRSLYGLKDSPHNWNQELDA